MFGSLRHILHSERVRQAALALLLALAISATTLLRPLDVAAWSVQAKLFDRQASGDIVFVPRDGSGAGSSNADLVATMDKLEAAGAERVYLNVPLARGEDIRADAALRERLADTSRRFVAVQTYRDYYADARQEVRAAGYFTDGAEQVSGDFQTDFLGFVWDIPRSQNASGHRYPALPFALAGEETPKKRVFTDFAIDPETVPRVTPAILRSGPDVLRDTVEGKAVVIGLSRDAAEPIEVPGARAQPATVVHILAAETLRMGRGDYLNWLLLTLAFGLALLIGLMLAGGQRGRRILYGAWMAATPALFLLAGWLGTRAFFADIVALGAFYAFMRALTNYRRRHLFVDPASRLPNFNAMLRDIENDRSGRAPTIVVAKIARLDAMFTMLSAIERGDYLRQVAFRLALGDHGKHVYYDGGKYFAMPLVGFAGLDLQSHLEGLRAVATQSVQVAGRPLDVSMTFGADECATKDLSSRLSSAISAADQAREAYRPVFIISEDDRPDEAWDYSLQSRLEAALSEDRIGINLQPQVDLATGRIAAAEALARWRDAERGDIAPVQFILQCERMGRLDELTKRVLGKGLRATGDLAAVGAPIPVSVNVSAIQFVDMRIADMVETQLAMLGTDPALLTIEITETARMDDMRAARDVMERIGRLGVRFSIDDFGVGSANHEVLYSLPFDEVKIDRMFVDAMDRSAKARSIVAATTGLARGIGLVCVAEGIETAESAKILREMGCTLGQGYHFYRPMTAAALAKLIEDQTLTAGQRSQIG